MKFLLSFFMTLCSCALVAQTVSVQKYGNGMPDTIWHIRAQDTFLMGHFWQNGNIKNRRWKSDSIYFYDNQGNINKKSYKYNKSYPDWIHWNYGSYDQNILSKEDCQNYKKTIRYYPDMSLHARSEWITERFFIYESYLPNGQIFETKTVQQISARLFLLETSRLNRSKSTTIIDIDNRIQNATHFYPNGQISTLFKSSFENQEYSNGILEGKQFDTTGQLIYHWKLDSNLLNPFKDNGLCLYGFQNMKGETVIQPQYQDVTKINVSNHFNTNSYFIVNDKRKYSVINDLGKVIIAPEWDFIGEMLEDVKHWDTNTDNENYPLHCQNALGHGIISLQGKMMLNPVYQGVASPQNDLFRVQIGRYFGIIRQNGQIVIAPQYDYLEFTKYDDLFYTVKISENQNSKYGLINNKDQVLLPCIFERINADDFLSERSFRVDVFTKHENYSYNNSKSGIFNADKGWLFDTIYRYDMAHSNYSLVSIYKNEEQSENNLQGLFEKTTAKLLLPLEYQKIQSFTIARFNKNTINPSEYLQHDTLYKCQKQDKWGIFDPKQRKWLIPLKYDYLESINDTAFFAGYRGKYLVINHLEHFCTPDTFEHIGHVAHNDYYFAQKKDTVLFYDKDFFPKSCGLNDLKEKNFYLRENLKAIILLKTLDDKELIINDKATVIAPTHYKIMAFGDDYVVATDTTQQIYLIDNQGKKQPFLSQYKIKSVQTQTNRVIVEDTTRKKLGVVTMQGKSILPCEYFGIYAPDNEGILWVKKENVKLPTYFESLKEKEWYFYSDTICPIDGHWMMFNKDGKQLIINEFDYAFRLSNGLGIGRIQGKHGLWNSNGTNIIPPIYDKIWCDSANHMFYLFQFQKDGSQLVGFADENGKIIVEPHFKNMSCFNGNHAFVETTTGTGVIAKNGAYLIPIAPYALQQSSIDLITLMSTFKDSIQNKIGEWHHPRTKYLFVNPLRTVRTGKDSILAKQLIALSGKNKIIFQNLLVEQFLPAYWLHGRKIFLDRTQSTLYCNWHLNIYMRPFWEEQLSSIESELDAVSITKENIGISMNKKAIRRHIDGTCRGAGISIEDFECFRFQKKGAIWQPLELDNLLILNEQNIAILNQMFVKKISTLKKLTLDCANPSIYISLLKYRFWVLEDGIEFYMTHNYNINYQKEAIHRSIPIRFTWAELKPFLK